MIDDFIIDGRLEVGFDRDTHAPYFMRVPDRTVLNPSIEVDPDPTFITITENPDDGKLFTMSLSNGVAVYRMEYCERCAHLHMTLQSWTATEEDRRARA